MALMQEAFQKTVQVWQPYYSQNLTESDGREIMGNWLAYIGLLSEWASTAGSKD